MALTEMIIPQNADAGKPGGPIGQLVPFPGSPTDIVLSRLKDVRQGTDGQYLAHCPAHEDKQQSLSIGHGSDGRVLMKCFAGCNTRDILKAIGLEFKDLFPASTRKYQPDRPALGPRRILAVAALAADKGFTEDYLKGLGVIQDRAGVRIQYLLEDGTPARRQRLRTALRATDGSRWIRGEGSPCPYGLWRWADDTARAGYGILVEGESDCWTLWYHDFPALGIPGAGMAKVLEPAHLAGVSRLYVFQEPDAGGAEFVGACAKRLRAIGWAGQASIIRLPDTKDPNELHKKDRDGFKAEFQKALDRAEPLPDVQEQDTADQRPTIIITGNLMETTGLALDALAEANKREAAVFVRSSMLSRVTTDEKGRPVIQPITESALRGILARVASFQECRGKGEDGEPKYVEVHPPMSVVKDIMNLPRWDFPRLESVVQTPVLRPDGTIVKQPGYDPATGVYLIMAPGIEPALAVPDRVTQENARAACRFILEELLGDFCFVDQASRANALGYMITIVIRPAIPNARVLMALIDAPRQGNGKSLLVESLLTVVTGSDKMGVMNAPDDEDEWRKQITAQLFRGASAVVIDNVVRPLASPALAVAVSQSIWEDRMLGQTKTLSLPCNTVWAATGNNIRLRGDLPRRCYWCRLDAGVSKPWERTGFRHPDLLAWVNAHRGELLAAVLKMARAWYLAGRPPAQGVPIIGGFNEWAQTVGGILAYSGVDGFLGNLSAMHDTMDEETPQWEAFLAQWFNVYKSDEITVAELVADIRAASDDALKALRETLPDELADALPKEKDGEAAPTRKFGKRLGAKKDTVYGPYDGGYSLKLQAGTMQRGIGTWKVVPVWPPIQDTEEDDDPVF